MYSSARRNRAYSPEPPSSRLYSPMPCPPSPMIPTIPDEDDEHTLCAFGDISLTEQCFIPSLPSDASPVKGDSFHRPRRASPAAAAHAPRGAMANRPRPPILLKSKNPYVSVSSATARLYIQSINDRLSSLKPLSRSLSSVSRRSSTA